MNSFNVDRIVQNVKSIADKCRCVSCDKLEGLRVRYPCGHSVCETCVLIAVDCSLCFSPPEVSTHVNDCPQTLRIEHASNLLQSFQELFKLDVYRRKRVSEKLQLEKQLFPECIQAPSKYSNSRRSSNISIQNKENIKHRALPGENTSTPNILKMENKISYVQQWLNKNETSLKESNLPRKPFSDINVNRQNVIQPKTPNKVTKKKKTLSRNTIHSKSFKSGLKNKSKLSLTKTGKDVRRIDKEDLNETIKCDKNESDSKSFKSGLKNKSKLSLTDTGKDVTRIDKGALNKTIKCDKNESENVIEDQILIIDNTHESLDKDFNAWKAVLEAEKKCPSDTTISTLKSENEINIKYLIDKPILNQDAQAISKVPFYKKSSLLKCVNKHFKESMSNNNIENTNSNVTITVDHSNFVTTLKFYEAQDNKKINTTESTKYSIGVQTEDENNFESSSDKIIELKVQANKNINIEKLATEQNHDVNKESVDLFEEITEANHKNSQPVKEPTLIIDDSDSDSDISPTGKDSLLEVTAEVHRSETENDSSVLSQLEQGEYEHRKRHAVRGHTPVSTDSSDKENYDPNRAKRHKLDKKHCKKY